MIPFGLGSGFEGGITTPHGGVSIDLRRMNQGMVSFSNFKRARKRLRRAPKVNVHFDAFKNF